MEIKTVPVIKRITYYIGQLRDVRAIGMLLFLFIVLLVSWSGAKAIETNYRLQKNIARLEQQNEVQQLINTNLELENEYYATDRYLEIAARQNFGLAANGETVLNVPKNVALAYTIDLPDAEREEADKAEARKPEYQRNFEAWIDFLLHRQTVSD